MLLEGFEELGAAGVSPSQVNECALQRAMEILPSMPDLLFDDSTIVESFEPAVFDAPDASDLSVSILPENEPTAGILNDLVEDLIEDVIFGFCLEVHRSMKIGTFFLADADTEAHKHYEIVDMPGVDIFGQVPTKKSLECTCPHCHRNMAASRFAPHLEKCMGMGRNSSRLASRRIANVGKHDSDNESIGDDNNDNDWSYYGERKAKIRSREFGAGKFGEFGARKSSKISEAKKVKKEKLVANSPRRVKAVGHPKVRSGDGAGEVSYQTVLANMTLDERRTLLLNICAAVTSEQTKKLCTRSVRCTQHSEEQRQASRALLLSKHTPAHRLTSDQDDDHHVDIDTYDDLDNQALREALDWDVTPNSSPADSTSTVNSVESSQRQRGRGRKGRRKE